MSTMLDRVIIVGTVVLTLSVCHCFGHRRRIQGPTLPTKAMNLNTFLSQVATGRTYHQLYTVFASPQPDFTPLQNYKLTPTTALAPSGGPVLTLTAGGRNADGMCTQFSLDLQVARQRKSRARAIFDEISGGSSRIWYFTTNPDEYLLEFTCNNFNGRPCQDDFFFNLFTARFPPNQFDWKRIVWQAKRLVGIDFTDPRSVFTRVADDCPDP